MLTEIGIENFKCFGKMQRIPLKPITLLYGPNSSGKSSLLQALLLFKQTLEESGDKAIVLLPKGNMVDLGGYHEFIHKHDRRREFRMGFTFHPGFYIEDERWQLPWYGVNPRSIEFAFYQDNKETFVKSIVISSGLDGMPIVITIDFTKVSLLSW